MPGRWLPAAARVCHPPAATLACRGPWKGTAGLESRPSPPYSGQQGLILEEAVEGEESSNRRVPGQTRLAFWGGRGGLHYCALPAPFSSCPCFYGHVPHHCTLVGWPGTGAAGETKPTGPAGPAAGGHRHRGRAGGPPAYPPCCTSVLLYRFLHTRHSGGGRRKGVKALSCCRNSCDGGSSRGRSAARSSGHSSPQ